VELESNRVADERLDHGGDAVVIDGLKMRETTKGRKIYWKNVGLIGRL
jgi:DsbC/DsbD-like thiol-disulfide interchange protein